MKRKAADKLKYVYKLDYLRVVTRDAYRNVQEPFWPNKTPIRVRWPDGTRTNETLVVVDQDEDLFHSPQIRRTRELFVAHQHHGVKVLVPLFGLMIARIDDP